MRVAYARGTLDFPLNVPVMKSREASRTAQAGKEPGVSALLWGQEERGLACPDCICARGFLISYNKKYQSFLATCSVPGTLPLLMLEVFTVHMPTWELSSEIVKAQWSE